jgi:thiol-disulfide isomerase/thioredoxin
MRVRLILPALLVAVTATTAVAGCGSATHRGTAAKPAAEAKPQDNEAKPQDNEAKQEAKQQDKAANAVPESLKFTGTTLDGKHFDGASLAGHPVVLWFWAPWCATCAGEAATVADAANQYKGKVDIVGVAGMGPEKDMHQFVKDEEVGNIIHLSDDAGVVWKRFGITEQSLYVMLDRTGKVVVKGFMDDQVFGKWMAKIATT